MQLCFKDSRSQAAVHYTVGALSLWVNKSFADIDRTSATVAAVAAALAGVPSSCGSDESLLAALVDGCLTALRHTQIMAAGFRSRCGRRHARLLERLITSLSTGGLPAVFIPAFVSTSAPGRRSDELPHSLLVTLWQSRCLNENTTIAESCEEGETPRVYPLYALGGVTLGAAPLDCGPLFFKLIHRHALSLQTLEIPGSLHSPFVGPSAGTAVSAIAACRNLRTLTLRPHYVPLPAWGLSQHLHTLKGVTIAAATGNEHTTTFAALNALALPNLRTVMVHLEGDGTLDGLGALASRLHSLTVHEVAFAAAPRPELWTEAAAGLPDALPELEHFEWRPWQSHSGVATITGAIARRAVNLTLLVAAMSAVADALAVADNAVQYGQGVTVRNEQRAPLLQLRSLTLTAVTSDFPMLRAILRAAPHLVALTLEHVRIRWHVGRHLFQFDPVAAAEAPGDHQQILHPRVRRLTCVVDLDAPPIEWRRACAVSLRLRFPRMRFATLACEADPTLDDILYPPLEE